jgi:hypothetical protein
MPTFVFSMLSAFVQFAANLCGGRTSPLTERDLILPTPLQPATPPYTCLGETINLDGDLTRSLLAAIAHPFHAYPS